MPTNNKVARCRVTRRSDTRNFLSKYASDQDGSLTIFSIFIFVMILLITGIAVDVMHYESRRAGLQNVVDSAVVATASLNQDADTQEDIEALIKEYVSKAGYDPDAVSVRSEFESTSAGITSRAVSANVNFEVDTFFMGMMGIETLPGNARSAAEEREKIIEIVLVLDVSGSMGWGTKLSDLKTAAKDFVTTVMDNNSQAQVMISIVPYNQQVHIDEDLRSRLNWDNRTIRVSGRGGRNRHPGAITEYNTYDPAAPCAFFHSADFATPRLAEQRAIDSPALFSEGWNFVSSTNIPGPGRLQSWCDPDYTKVMLYETNESVLHTHIDSLFARGFTAIDYGMNWAVGLLDPSFEPVVEHMVDRGILSDDVRGHPVDYNSEDVLKYIVLMTDGINTKQADLKEEYKSGPTRIWHSEELAAGREFNGFLVEMPNRPQSQRWFVPGSPTTTADDRFISDNAFPRDAIQWSFPRLYGRFRADNVPYYFFRNADTAAFTEYRNVVAESGFGAADTQLLSICDVAKAGERIEVFTVAFEAPDAANRLLKDCASGVGNHFDVDGTQISDAFSAIATQISQLRLTE